MQGTKSSFEKKKSAKTNWNDEDNPRLVGEGEHRDLVKVFLFRFFFCVLIKQSYRPFLHNKKEEKKNGSGECVNSNQKHTLECHRSKNMMMMTM